MLAASLCAAAAFAGAGASTARAAHEAARARQSARSAPPAGGGQIPVTVGTTLSGASIAPGFLGVAIEYSEVPQLAGPSPSSVNPVFRRLLANLNPGGYASIRIGGISTDRSWWPVPGMARPPGITYNLTPRWAQDAQALARATGATLIPGIELEADSTRISAVEARQLLARIGRRYIQAFEIGNEPPLYTNIPWYRELDGRRLPWYAQAGVPVLSRPLSWSIDSFIAEFRATVRALPRVPIAGPALGKASWLDAFAQTFGRRSRVRMITYHAYGLNQCIRNPRSVKYPSVSNLLSFDASRSLLYGTADALQAAQRAGQIVRVAEMGAVTCGGTAGVSDSFASALWLLDALFDMAAHGVAGVNVHSFPGAYGALFDFARARGRWLGSVEPIYYGALAFARAAPAGAQLLGLTNEGRPNLRAWATRTPSGTVNVVLINDSLQGQSRVALRVAAVAGAACAQWLRASSAYATSGVTLGARSFGAQTATGTLAAPVRLEIRPSRGVYHVTLPRSSAVLLTFAPPSAKSPPTTSAATASGVDGAGVGGRG
jgi:hypothetical protein